MLKIAQSFIIITLCYRIAYRHQFGLKFSGKSFGNALATFGVAWVKLSSNNMKTETNNKI